MTLDKKYIQALELLYLVGFRHGSNSKKPLSEADEARMKAAVKDAEKLLKAEGTLF